MPGTWSAGTGNKERRTTPETTSSTAGHIGWKDVSDKLQNLLRLRTLPTGMKLFETVDEMEAIPKIRWTAERW
jgi:hypothetical protein